MRLAKRWLRFFSLKSRRDRRRRGRRDEFARLAGFEPLESRCVLSVSLGLSDNSFAENGGTTIVTATLSALLGSDVTVPLVFSGTATENTNFSASVDSITIPAGSLSNSATLTGIDTSDTDDQSLIVSEGAVTGDTVGTPSSVTATLTGDPTVNLSLASPSLAENGGTDTLTATLSAASSTDTTVNLDFSTGTARENMDFSSTHDSILIPAGQTTASVTLTGIDTSSFTDKSIIAEISGVTAGIVAGADSTVTASLTGDPTVNLTDSAGGSFAENGGTDTVIATLSSAATGPVSITLDFAGTADSSSYMASSTVITINKGDTTGSITLTGVDMEDSGGDILVSVDALNTTGAAPGATPSDDIMLIGDPDVSLAVDNSSFAENGGSATVTATLSAASAVPVTINLGSSSSGTDYSTSADSITIQAGDLTGSITLTGADNDDPNDETVTVSIASGSGYVAGSPSSVSATVLGDPTVSLSLGSGSFAENGGTDVVTATLDSPAVNPVTIGLDFAGTAPTTSYSASAQSITIMPGATTGSITLTGVDTGSTSSSDVAVSIDAGTTTGAAVGSPSSVDPTLAGDPSVSLAIDNSSFDENGGSATVTATLSATSTVPVTINLGSSSSGTDYSTSADSITIQAGDLTGSITLSGADNKDPNDETVTVSIASGSGYVVGSPSSVSATVLGDPTVTLSLGSGSFAENGGSDTVTATLSAPATGTVTITLNYSGSVTEGQNFSASSDTITIQQGDSSGTITLTGIDTQDSTDEPFTVGIASSVGAAIGNPSSQTETITGDPFVSLSVGSGSFAENGGTDTVTATLSAPATGTVTINLNYSGSVTEGQNFSTSSDTITINQGDTSGTITLTGIDTQDSTNEPFTVGIASSVGAALGNPSSQTETIDGDPTVSLAISSSSFAEAGGSDTITATLSAPSTTDITVNLGFSGGATEGTNYTASATSILIPAGSTSESITLTGVDMQITTNQDVTASIASGSGYAIGSPASVSATLAGDLTVTLSDSVGSGGSFAEDGGTDTITATLSDAATSTVTINLAFAGTAPTTSYSASSQSITIAAGATTGFITLTGIDTGTTSNQDVSVSIASASGATVISPSSVDPTLAGDPTVNLSLSTDTFDEAAGTDTVTATLSAASPVAITVNLSFSGTANNGTDYTASSSTISIPAGSTSGTITLTAIDENLSTGSPTVIVSISSVSTGAAVGSTSSVTATIEDDDGVAPPTGVTLSSSSGVAGLTNYVTTDAPSFTITATTGETVQILVNGTEVATATESSTPGQYTVSIPAGELQVGNNSITSTAGTSSGTSSPSTAMTLIYAPAFSDVYTVPGAIGSSVSVTFDYTSRNAAYNDEVGFFVVSDSTGTVNGIAPGAAGYAQAALSSAIVLFSGATNSPGATKTVTLTGGELIAYYMVQNNSTANFLSSNPSDKIGGILAFFSIDAANPDPVRHVDTTGNPTTGNVQYSWEDETDGGDKDYNDMVISVVPSTTSGQTDAALVVPGSSTDSVSLTFTLSDLAGSLAGDVGIYYVTDSTGAVSGVEPGGSGYAADALGSSNYQVLFAAGSTAGMTQTITLAGGTQFAFYTINSGTTSTFLSANSGNSTGGSPVALFSFDTSNPDGENHFRWFDPEGVSDISPSLDSLSDPQLLHVMDQVYGGNSDFDSFDVGVQL